ncbi:RNA/RNP complex-1-interacting phosphatase [Cylas formicarius]|uniref:RNA/RNP complex-1-interacting phosphatase n=1 Tax=Cylas formicarius TaxID=197179 RepID=UPI0029586845|nr:RNA/RNP complex-1-interacting phosphatase [Cylas formicarius]
MGKSKKTAIPDRWSNYKPIGQRIPGTKIVAFKVPLAEDVCKRNVDEKEWFTPSILVATEPGLKTIIDLTNTWRYYNWEEEFGTRGIDHVKIMVEGRTVPKHSQVQQFFSAVDRHLEKHADDEDALIGVHCTHGLNRTGYFICRWMVERLKIHVDDAINRFEVARGHPIERKYLLKALRNGDSSTRKLPPSSRQRRVHRSSVVNWRTEPRTNFEKPSVPSQKNKNHHKTVD